MFARAKFALSTVATVTGATDKNEKIVAILGEKLKDVF